MSLEGRLFGGRYRTERLLGKGGFGVVYRAVDENTGRPVALKLLRGTELGDEARHRFQREARVVQQLNHPNTVRLFDFGVDADRAPYIVYELLEGETLSQIMKTGPIPLERTTRIATQLLKALSEAHQLGIVHRDIKPANVMVVQFSGDRDVVKLLDFGIAKPLMAATRALTTTGTILGTPRFMSPEQVRGDEIQPSSDVYSIALLLSEMLTGTRVFDGPPMEVMMAQMAPNPVVFPPFVRSSPFGRVLARAVEKDPGKRFQNATEMLAALQARAPEPTVPRTVDEVIRAQPARSTAPPPVRKSAMTPIVLLASTGALAFLVVLFALGIAWYLNAERTAPGAPTARARATETAQRADSERRPPVDTGLRSFDLGLLMDVPER